MSGIYAGVIAGNERGHLDNKQDNKKEALKQMHHDCQSDRGIWRWRTDDGRLDGFLPENEITAREKLRTNSDNRADTNTEQQR